MQFAKSAPVAFCLSLILLFSGCANVKVVDDTNGSAQPSTVPLPPSPPAAAPNFSGGLPSPDFGSGNPSSIFALAQYMMGSYGANSSSNGSGIGEQQLAAIMQMMGGNGTGGYALTPQQLALLRQMMASYGNGTGNDSFGSQQYSSYGQMMANGNSGLDTQQLAALQQTMANGNSGTGASQQLALLRQKMMGGASAGGYGSLTSRQLALVQQMMGSSSGAGGLDSQKLAILQQMSENGGNGGLDAQQIAAIQQAASRGSSPGELDARQLEALGQMMAGTSTQGLDASQLAAIRQMIADGGNGGYDEQTLPQATSSGAQGAANTYENGAEPVSAPPATSSVNVTYFYKPACPYCVQVAPTISQMKQMFAQYNWKEVDVETTGGYAQFDSTIRRLNLSGSYYVVPFVLVNSRALVGVSDINGTLPTVLAGLA